MCIHGSALFRGHFQKLCGLAELGLKNKWHTAVRVVCFLYEQILMIWMPIGW